MKYILFLLASFSAYTQEIKITIPEFNDDFSNYVKQLEAGKTDIDYQLFRYSFLKSAQFKIASTKSTEYNGLKSKMYEQMEKKNFIEVINITKQMLSIDYTSMIAHKILRQSYKIIGDTENAEKYKTIQFGLLESIVKKGDGKTCATAWPVIQIEEEYFILEMIGATLKKQSIYNTGGVCDQMEVLLEDGEKKIYYFDTVKVFEGYKILENK
ncbi:DUF4919 domain-containing protein [Flavobacterium sp. AG291]|uniref:DUF4919 domain-containing protein n=1 Tax=Flavobacterium sp. AG291 TaxID=2184000 RepID=UPI000E0C7BD2|nr:DUF4919 domain-containing protein [Flavobacterium sp. AG291]